MKRIVLHMSSRDQCPAVAEELARVENSEQMVTFVACSEPLADPFLCPANDAHPAANGTNNKPEKFFPGAFPL